jgi:hypothetical protein
MNQQKGSRCSSTRRSLREACDQPGDRVHINVEEARARGQAGNGRQLAAQRIQEARTDAGPNVTNGHREACQGGERG